MAAEDRPIVIVGCGPGSAKYLTLAALEAVNSADVLVGAQRLLDLFPGIAGMRIPVEKGIEKALNGIGRHLGDGNIVVLVTGDPGLFSLARLVVKRFGRRNCRVIPGISSVQAAFAAIGLDWGDAAIISAHKKDPEIGTDWYRYDKIAVLGGRESSLRWIGERLLPDQGNRRVFVCENLTLEDETVREIDPEDLSELVASPRTVVLIIERNVLE
jgi:cobalt-precorrin-7 (C5)-methyltransferase